MASITTTDNWLIRTSRSLRRSIVAFVAGAALAGAIAVGAVLVTDDSQTLDQRSGPPAVQAQPCDYCIPLIGPR